MAGIKDYIPFMGQGLNVGGSIVGSILTNRANKKMADTAFAREKEMWQAQNAYNSPLAQQARFKEAGLNPNLIYGQGSAGNASSAPHYQAPRQEYNLGQLDLGSALGQYMDLQVRGQQILNQKEQNRSIHLQNMMDGIRLAVMMKFALPNAKLGNQKLGFDTSISGSNMNIRENENRASSVYMFDKWKNWEWKNKQAEAQIPVYQQQFKNLQIDENIKKTIQELKDMDLSWYKNGGRLALPFFQLLRLLKN